jgi:hypothetical protein
MAFEVRDWTLVSAGTVNVVSGGDAPKVWIRRVCGTRDFP